jgi:anaerobic ribonucleoside-triphosphate reductase
MGTCNCGDDLGTRACAIGETTSLEYTCPKCGNRRAATVRWMLGRVSPVLIFEDRPPARR